MSVDLIKLNFGRWMKRAREAANLTQADVAKQLSYDTPQFISNWERAISHPPVAVFAHLVRIYKLDRKEAQKRFRDLKMLPVERDLGDLKRMLG